MVGLIDGANWAEAVTGIGTVVIAAGLVFAGFQVRESRRSRHADLAVDVSERWDHEYLVTVRALLTDLTPEELRTLYLDLYKSRDPEVYILQREPNFFEDLGVLQKLRCISLEWIDETLGGLTVERWRLWSPTIETLRSGISGPEWPRAYSNFERLARKLKKRRSGRRFFGRYRIVRDC